MPLSNLPIHMYRRHNENIDVGAGHMHKQAVDDNCETYILLVWRSHRVYML